MKKRILIAVACVLLSAVILLLPHPNEQLGTQPSTSKPHNTLPTIHTAGRDAVVRLYSCDAQWLASFADLAARYTQLTGTEVVLLQSQGDDCQAYLAQLMESEEPPTVLCVHSQQQLEMWKENLLDLQPTDLASALCHENFGLYADGKLLALPVDLDGFGLLMNAQVLGAKGALSRNDITDAQTLAMAVQILKDNSAKAFPAARLDIMSALYLLHNSDPTQLRAFLDLYASNCLADGDAQAQFAAGKSAFYLGGTWNYDRIAAQATDGLQLRDLDILPNYYTGAMQYVFSAAWCVNGSARWGDVQATLAFLTWLVTAGEDGVAPVDALQIMTPFADAAWYGNQLEKKLLGYRTSEPAQVFWAPESGGHTKLLNTLQAYMASRTDANWDLLQNLLQQVGLGA